MPTNKIPLYPYNAKDAMKRGELEKWRESFRENCACAGGIDILIRENFDGMHLKKGTVLKDVGWALIDYIQNGRPNIDCPFVFLTHIPPFKNYSDENHLHATISKYLQMTDIQNQPKKKRGMHSLRHTLANHLQENKETLHTISSAMGHSSPDSASIYVKTDIDLLRECSLSLSEVRLWEF